MPNKSIDEIEARLHPNLVEYIVALFNQYPSENAQLIFTTHDSNLLSADLFRRDQIWITEKNTQTQQTELASFADYDIRQDASYEKLYLTGRVGGTPFIRHKNIDSMVRLLNLQAKEEAENEQ